MTADKLPDPQIVLGDDGTPRSGVSGDVYFSVTGGIAETRHVFLGGIGAPGCWQGAGTTRIGELGFGTGLNFLVAWHDWAKDAAPDASLDYVAIEGYPPDAATLVRAFAPMAEVAREAASLIAAWPPRVPGLHRLLFDGGRVRLTLAFGEVGEMLARLTGSVDAWFLDGFAPAKNPAMWRPEVLSAVARMTRPGGRAASFTVAGDVRRGLEAVGFKIEKRPGFGHKRECLAAMLPGEAPAPALPPGARVAIVGAGIAGAAMTRALSARGFRPALLDPSPGGGASGNPAALIAPRLPRQRSPQGLVMALSYPFAVRYYDMLAGEGAAVWQGRRGAAALARDDAEDERQRLAVEVFGLPEDVMIRLDAAALSERLGEPVSRPGLWFPGAGTLSPIAVTKHLRDGPVRRERVEALTESARGWSLSFAGGGTLDADALVLSAGTGILDLLPGRTWPVRANRGQISYLAPMDGAPRHAVSFGGYLTPAVPLGDGRQGHVIGATYARPDEVAPGDWDTPRAEDDATNLAGLVQHFPHLRRAEVIGARTALRVSVRDYLPLAGAVGQRAWMLGGLGSRGFLTAPLMAECVADLMTGAPPPLPPDLLDAINPGRFS